MLVFSAGLLSVCSALLCSAGGVWFLSVSLPALFTFVVRDLDSISRMYYHHSSPGVYLHRLCMATVYVDLI